MSHYDNDMFSSTDAATTTDADAAAESYDIRKWKLGNHGTRPSVDIDALRADAERNANIDDDLANMLEQAAERLDTVNVNDFECPVCGLSHGHSDDKHDIRPTFNVEASFAERMEFAPNCHCGVNELAMLMEFTPYIIPRMFTDDEKFEVFVGMMPSDEAEMALDLYYHPNVKVGTLNNSLSSTETVFALRDRHIDAMSDDQIIWATHEQIIEAARLPVQQSVINAFKDYTDRLSNVRNAANNAPIPSDTEARIESIRSDLEVRFE